MDIDLKTLSIALCTIGMHGAAIGVSNVFSSAVESIARNPVAEQSIVKVTFIGAALSEAMGLCSFLIAMLLLFM